MNLREQLIRHHQAEIRALERSMTNTDSEIRSLEGHIAAMKDEYARMIQAAYKHSLGHNPDVRVSRKISRPSGHSVSIASILLLRSAKSKWNRSRAPSWS